MAVRENWKVSFPFRHWNCLPIWDATGTRGQWEAKKSREKKERFENNFSYFIRRTGNLKSIFPVLRREIEIRQNIINFREEKGICFAQALRRETEILNMFLQFWKEKENIVIEIILLYFESKIPRGRGKPRVISLREFLELKTVFLKWMAHSKVNLHVFLCKRRRFLFPVANSSIEAWVFSGISTNIRWATSAFICNRVRKSKNFPDSKIFTKTFRIKCVNRDIDDFATNARKT